MIVLTIDIGNSRAKLDVWKDDEHIFHVKTPDLSWELADSLISQFKIDGISVSSVSYDCDHLISEIKKRFNGPVLGFGTGKSTQYEVISSYKKKLGVDRLAAFIGAVSLFPSVSMLIIDAGTALTIDVADKEGRFMGGNISIGLSGRLKALHDYTERLPLVSVSGEITPFGTDTESAIRDGAVSGVVGEIVYDYSLARVNYEAEIIVMTGGDAPLLMPFLTEKEIKVHYDPYLVGRGLNLDFRRVLGVKPVIA